jgi:tRNA-Thr(GGU) m(6)t(6)A37 methyltransferase TsaA
MSSPLPAIGVVRSGRLTTESTLVQAALNRGESGRIEIHPEYVEGLAGLEGFDYAWLLTWLHRPRDTAVPMTQVPFLLRRSGRPMGVFATRSPRRVNSIGLSLVSLGEISGTTVAFAGVDVVDGTPVLDLKPYVTRFDAPDTGPVRCGWFDEIELADGVTPADLTPPR